MAAVIRGPRWLAGALVCVSALAGAAAGADSTADSRRVVVVAERSVPGHGLEQVALTVEGDLAVWTSNSNFLARVGTRKPTYLGSYRVSASSGGIAAMAGVWRNLSERMSRPVPGGEIKLPPAPSGPAHAIRVLLDGRPLPSGGPEFQEALGLLALRMGVSGWKPLSPQEARKVELEGQGKGLLVTGPGGRKRMPWNALKCQGTESQAPDWCELPGFGGVYPARMGGESGQR